MTGNYGHAGYEWITSGSAYEYDWDISYGGHQGAVEPQPDGSYLITQAAYPASYVPSFSVQQWRIEKGRWVAS